MGLLVGAMECGGTGPYREPVGGLVLRDGYRRAGTLSKEGGVDRHPKVASPNGYLEVIELFFSNRANQLFSRLSLNFTGS